MFSGRRYAFALLLLVLAVTTVHAGELPVTTKVLHNGCTLAVVENHQAPVVAVRVYIRNAGSLYEGEMLGTGISHYLQRVIHGGTTSTRTQVEAARILRSIGASTDSEVRRDVTCYHGVTHVETFDVLLDLLADWVQNTSLHRRELGRAKEVVRKEMIQRRDEPALVAEQLLMETMFQRHPVRHPTTGYIDNFLRLGRSDLVRFARERYAPNNTVVVVAGDVDPTETVGLLETAFLSWERQPDLDHVSNLTAEPRQMGRRYAEKEMDVREAFVRVGFHTIELSHPDLYALDLLAAVLGNGRTSRLHRRLVDRDRLTDQVFVASHTPPYGAGVFHVVARCAYEDVPALERALLEEIARIADEAPTGEELVRAKALVERGFLMNHLRAADQAELVALDLMGTGNPNYSARYVEAIRAVTGEQVRAMAGKYLARQNETLVVVKPIGEPAVFDRPEAAARGDAATPGETRKVVLENGLTILLQRNPATPTVGVQAFFRAGVLWETDENAGLSNLMARLMLRGTKTRSASDIAEEMEGAGALMSAVSGNNTFGMSMALPSRDLDMALALFADVLRNPSFPEGEVAREKGVSKMLIRRQAGNWQTEAYRNFRTAMFRDHPYRRDRFGTFESIDRIDRSAVTAHHATYCTPQNGVVAVFGDLDLERAEKAIRAVFADWTRGEDVARRVPVEKPLAESRVVAYPSSKGLVVISLGFPGATLDSADRWVLQVIDAALSGLTVPSGRLPAALRGERNLVYAVNAYSWNGFGAGSFYVVCPCLPNLYDEVISTIRREFARVASDGFTPEELENAKRMCVTSDLARRQTNSEQAMAAALDELYGFGGDSWRTYSTRIRAVTNEDVKRVAVEYFENSVLVLTAPESWLKLRGMVGGDTSLPDTPRR